MEEYVYLFLTRVLPMTVALIVLIGWLEKASSLYNQGYMFSSRITYSTWMLAVVGCIGLGVHFWNPAELFIWVICVLVNSLVTYAVILMVHDDSAPGGERPSEAMVRMGFANPDDITEKGSPTKAGLVAGIIIGLIVFILLHVGAIHLYLKYLNFLSAS